MQNPESLHPPGTLSLRGALDCVTWAGTGLLWWLGALVCHAFWHCPGARRRVRPRSLHLSADQRQPCRLQQACPIPTHWERCARRWARSDSCPRRPPFHIGDISHPSKGAGFRRCRPDPPRTGVPLFFVPDDTDLLDDEQGRPWTATASAGDCAGPASDGARVLPASNARIRHRAQRAYPPNHPEDGEQRPPSTRPDQRPSRGRRPARRPQTGPTKVPAGALRTLLGITRVNFIRAWQPAPGDASTRCSPAKPAPPSSVRTVPCPHRTPA